MFAGHFGLAAAVKAKEPEVPAWALMLSTQLLDVLFVPMVMANVETIDAPPQGGYGEGIIHAYYTHSLVGALLISAIAGLAAGRFWGKRSGLVITGMVFSHWLLDLLVHRADLPVLPGNLGNLPLLGFGLWNYPLVSGVVELGLVTVGAFLYFTSAMKRAENNFNPTLSRSRAIMAGTVMGLLLILSLVTDVTGIA